MLDEDIVQMAQGGNEGAQGFLLTKYVNFVRAKARSYFLVGAEREDIIQEGMIGLFKAIRDYRSDKLSSFKAFADLCITRQMITAIKGATRQKHTFLNGYVSLDRPIYSEDSDRTLLDVLAGNSVTNPEELTINGDDFREMQRSLVGILSDLEREVLLAYLDGRTYREIADSLGRHVKSVDNSLQRVKRKLLRYLQERALAEGHGELHALPDGPGPQPIPGASRHC